MYAIEMMRSDSRRAVANARSHQRGRVLAVVKTVLWHVAMFVMESVIVFVGFLAIGFVMYALALN
jgi:hypothetical protein